MEMQFHNQFLLSGQLLSVENKRSSQGKAYTVGDVHIAGLEVDLRYRALGDCQAQLSAGESFVLIGSFRYENKHVLLHISEVQIPVSNKPENHCHLTLRAGRDGELRYSKKGTAWALVPGALSMGKDRDGQYRPSWWLEVKGFAKGQDESIPLSIAALRKGDLLTAIGRLAIQTYQERESWSLVLNEAIPLPEEIPSASHAEVVPD